ncbi:sigma-70 family RNA polymerase sigma factor [bacterium]|nr:sigma-70 family RNA polymerase sigma factor [bacterium]
MPTDRQKDLDPAVAAVVRAKAHALARGGVIPRGDVGDAEQDLILAVLVACPAFDPGRGTPEGFARTVVRNAAAKLVRGRFAARRHPGRVGPLVALDAEPADPSGHPADRVARAADVAAVVAALPPDLRAAAEALKTDTVAAAARVLGVSRGTMYARVREIRSWFERAGLGDDR